MPEFPVVDANEAYKKRCFPDDELFCYEHDGETYEDGSAVRQCCHIDQSKKERCRNISVQGQSYCEEHKKLMKPTMRTKVTDCECLMSCNACRKYNNCPYAGAYVDIYGDKRCYVEKLLLKRIIEDFVETYDIDFSRIDNKIMLDRFAYSYVALQRAQDILSVTGEFVEREHVNLDGAVERWVELHPAVSLLKNYDSMTQAWFKMLLDSKKEEDKKRMNARKTYQNDNELIIDILANDSQN